MKTVYVLCLRLRNSVLNNLIHSHSFHFTYTPTTPNAVSITDISMDPLTHICTMKCFHLQISNLKGLKVSSAYSSHPAPGLCKWHQSPPHCPGQELALPMQGSPLKHIICRSPHLHCRHCLSKGPLFRISYNSLPTEYLGFRVSFLPIFHAVAKWPI